MSDGDEGREVRIDADVVPEWSWAAGIAEIPQIRSIVVSSSTPLPPVRIVARAWDGDFTIAEATLWEGALGADDQPLRVRALRLHTGYMATREERSGATLDISLLDMTDNGSVLATRRFEVDVQPPDLWWRTQGGEGLAEAMLAAFVRPNAPVVADIAREALEILRVEGGEAAFNAYQLRDAARQAVKADETAMALAQSIRNRRIGYSEPPPAWDYAETGQRIRPHELVASGGLGTCLDTTVLMAACLEHVGLNPVMMLVHRHIFCGYWRHDEVLPEPVLTDFAAVANLIQSGRIGLIETTMLTVSNTESLTEVFRSNERDYFRDHVRAPFRALIDVAAARMRRVTPLPAVEPLGSGELRVVEYRPGSPAPVVETVTAAEQETLNDLSDRLKDEQPARLRKWKSELLSLNATSPLLNLPANAQVQPILLPPAGLGPLEDQIHQDKEFEVRSGFDVDPLLAERGVPNMAVAEDDDQLLALGSRILFMQRLKRSRGETQPVIPTTMMSELRTMARRAKDAKDERGMNPLFLVLGMLRWGEGPGGAVNPGEAGFDAPLVLVPVRLTGGLRGRPLMLALDSSSHVTPNYALIEWLRREHGLSIPGLAEPALDKAGIDLDQVFDNVRSAVAAGGLSLQVVPQARLAILDVGAFRMWKDLQEHGETFLERPLVRHLVSTPTEQYVDPAVEGAEEVDLDNVVLPVAADAAQARAVAWARQGRTFVLQGPPGTGKSQTITNMIAACVADGRKVLFVAEKQTALSVVKRRLDAVGMGTFSLNLHQDGSSGAQVRQQLIAAIRARSESDPAVMEAAQRQRRTALHQLRQYPQSLHDRNQAGLSAYSARDQLLVLGDGPMLDISTEVVARHGDQVRAAVEAARDLPGLALTARPRAGHPWRLVGPVAAGSFDVAAASAVVSAVLDAARQCAEAPASVRAALDLAMNGDHIRQAAEISAPEAPEASLVQAALQPGWSQTVTEALTRMEADAAQWALSLGGFDPAVIALDLQALTQAVAQARTGMFIGRKGRVAAALAPLAPYAPQGQVDPDAADEILGRLSAVRAFYLPAAEWVRSQPALGTPVDWNPLVPGAVSELLDRVRRADAFAVPLRELGPRGDGLRSAVATGELAQSHEAIRSLAEAWSGFTDFFAVEATGLASWQGDRSVVDAIASVRSDWASDLADRIIGLQNWTAFRVGLDPLEEIGLAETVAGLADGSITPDTIEEALDRGVAHASLTERLSASGLDVFVGDAHQARIDKLRESEKAIRDGWPGHTAHSLIDARPGGGAIGALQRELTKTKGLLGTRAILRQHGEAVQIATPIVLTSPSSAVDLIEPGSLAFDVVIFDEASQIPVPEAIGALGRARAAIVVGDSKQMPPSRRIGAAAVADVDEVDLEVEEEIVEDQESILSECELAQVPTLRLDWHYRSQDEALIAFSNSTYYDGALSSFPTPTLLSHRTGVTLRPVRGRYIRAGGKPDESLAEVVRGRLRDVPGSVPFANTNIEEALEIVDEVARLVTEDPKRRPSIGIVTFNEQQRVLITSLLQAHDDPDIQAIQSESEMGAEDVLFVKALEQVQGDERDLVLFSIAFSKQANGQIPLNFGRLSTLGGERRLNVAVTRARRKNIVFCSFDPVELQAERSSYSGVKHLKEYLLFAKAAAADAAPTQLRVGGAVRDRHRDEIAEALRSRGVHVRTDVGMSGFRLDLVLSSAEDPDTPVLPVLLDGELWRRRETVGDREVLPVDVLTGLMGWPRVARVWWPMWVQNREMTIEALLAEFEQARQALATPDPSTVEVAQPVDLIEGPFVVVETPAVPDPAVTPVSTVAVEPESEREIEHEIEPSISVERAADPEIAVVKEPVVASFSPATTAPVTPSPDPHSLPEYVAWDRALGRALDDIPDDELDDLLVDIVNFEGPMHAELAFRRVVKASGGSKLGSRVKARLDEALKRIIRRSRVRVLKDGVRDPLKRTLYAPDRPSVLPRSAGDRSLEDVPWSELATVNDMFEEDIDEEALMRAVLALYGRKSLTGQAETLLTKAFGCTWTEA